MVFNNKISRLADRGNYEDADNFRKGLGILSTIRIPNRRRKLYKRSNKAV